MHDQVFTPLAGVQVLEVAQNLAGPYCSQILHDLGATVVKVEPPGGDPARSWGPPYVDGAGSIFAAANRGKRSVTLDLRQAADRAALRTLIADNDVLIEALRPGAFAALGFGYDAVRAFNPAVIYCSVLAYGETGPLRTLPGYDPLMQAHAGIMSVTGEPDGAASRVGTSVIDMGAGLWLALGVVAALRERDRTGNGTRLSVALYDTALAWNAYHLLGYLTSGFVPPRMGTELPMIAPYGAFAARDGRLMIAAANDRLFRRLCAALGHERLADDERFCDNAARVAHRDVLRSLIDAATGTHSVEELLALLRAHGVPCAPVQDIAAVAADPQMEASGMVCREADRLAFALPLRCAGVRPPARGTVPAAGEHTSGIVRVADADTGPV
jgi:crotonobetainyl-CoA:carnitine CoA-transferase CaiB-like acyl-CoA transferase